MNDLRFALRQLRRTPAFTVAAVLSLTLGIGATATIFNLVNGMLLRPPPGERPEELVRVYTTHPGGFQYGSLSYPDYLDLLGAEEALDGLALFRPVPLALGDGAAGERIWGQMVTSNLFAVLGVRPALGRGFLPDEDEPGASPVVVVAHHFWLRHFGGDPGAVGRTIPVNGNVFTVVGVAPEGFRGIQRGLDAEVFAPVGMAGILRPGVDVRDARGNRSFLATGRLAPGMTPEGATRALSLRMARLGELYPATNHGREMLALRESEVGWSPDLRGTTVASAVLFLSAGGLLLLLAAVNVSTLLLARARARRREMGVRVALGAGAGRLFR
jgi:predicted permease